MNVERLTTAQALVKWLVAQKVETATGVKPLFPGVFAIFGHGNVTCLAEALEREQDVLPTYRGQNEQGMALAGIAYAKAKRAEQIMVATSSVGPGATNMVTAAAVAMANRLPLLILSGDTFANRRPDPVLQQVEHFGEPSMTVNDAFKPVVRFWDRITHPEQLLNALPAATEMMLNPATRGPAFFGLPQDVQAMACDFPASFFDTRVWRIPRQRPDTLSVSEAAGILRGSKRPLIIAGGGTFTVGPKTYSTSLPIAAKSRWRKQQLAKQACSIIIATAWVSRVQQAPALPIVWLKTQMWWSALAQGCRILQLVHGVVFKTKMWFININAASFDAHKHRSHAMVGDAKVCVEELDAALGDWTAPGRKNGASRGRHDDVARVLSRKATANKRCTAL